MANSDTVASRVFTVAEANAALPEIRELLEKLRRSIRAFEEFRKLSGDDEEETPDGDTAVSPTYFRLVSSFHNSLNRIQEIFL